MTKNNICKRCKTNSNTENLKENPEGEGLVCIDQESCQRRKTMNVNNKINNINEPSESKGILSGLIKILILLVFTSSLFWNWDGFWQTNIKPLKSAQNSIFPAKYKEEQLKLSRIAQNNDVLDDIEDRVKRYKSKSDEALRKANLAKNKAISQAVNAKNELASYLEKKIPSAGITIHHYV